MSQNFYGKIFPYEQRRDDFSPRPDWRPGAHGMELVRHFCFQLQVKPGHIDAYRAPHAAAWLDMLEALHETGWHNYSIFLRPDGLVIGYFETEDLQTKLDGMAAAPVNARR